MSRPVHKVAVLLAAVFCSGGNCPNDQHVPLGGFCTASDDCIVGLCIDSYCKECNTTQHCQAIHVGSTCVNNKCVRPPDAGPKDSGGGSDTIADASSSADLPGTPPDGGGGDKGPLCATVHQPWTAKKDIAEPTALVCGATNVLSKDGAVAGMGFAATGKVYAPDPTQSTSVVAACVAVDFNQAVAARAARLTVRRVQTACNDSCTGTACNTGGHVNLYASSDGASWRYLTQFIASTSTLAQRTIPLPSGSLRHLLVCRAASGPARDNVELDHVELCQ